MDKQSSPTPLRVTMVVVLAVLLIGVFFRVNGLIYTGLVLGVLSLLSDLFTRYFAWIWMKFARAIGTINSMILLTIIFYCFLTPIALVYRVFSGTSLQQVESNQPQDTYFVERSKTFSAGDFENPW